MTLREKITNEMLKHAPIPQGKENKKRPSYYANFEDNLFCKLGKKARKAYDDCSGGETKETKKTYKNKKTNEVIKVVKNPPKMGSVSSSSAMTFNLLGNDDAEIVKNKFLPTGCFKVEFEKQMYTINMGSNPANLDAFLSNESEKTAVFCEMKTLEWLGAPSSLKNAYLDDKNYFNPDYTKVNCPVNAFEAFQEVINEITAYKTDKGCVSKFEHYDAWQMLKHLLAIYNYTSFVTKDAVEKTKIPSMAGKYNNIVLANVVNEFSPDHIVDDKVREEYIKALNIEHKEAQEFIEIIKNSKIPDLFKANCNAEIKVEYLSAKDFAQAITMSNNKRKYLERYF